MNPNIVLRTGNDHLLSSSLDCEHPLTIQHETAFANNKSSNLRFIHSNHLEKEVKPNIWIQ